MILTSQHRLSPAILPPFFQSFSPMITISRLRFLRERGRRGTIGSRQRRKRELSDLTPSTFQDPRSRLLRPTTCHYVQHRSIDHLYRGDRFGLRLRRDHPRKICKAFALPRLHAVCHSPTRNSLCIPGSVPFSVAPFHRPSRRWTHLPRQGLQGKGH